MGLYFILPPIFRAFFTINCACVWGRGAYLAYLGIFGCNPAPAPPAIGLVVLGLEAEFGGRMVLLLEEEEEDLRCPLLEVTVELVLLLVREEEVPLQVFLFPQSLTTTTGSSSAAAAFRRPLASTCTVEATVLSPPRLDDDDDRKWSSAVCLFPVSCCCCWSCFSQCDWCRFCEWVGSLLLLLPAEFSIMLLLSALRPYLEAAVATVMLNEVLAHLQPQHGINHGFGGCWKYYTRKWLLTILWKWYLLIYNLFVFKIMNINSDSYFCTITLLLLYYNILRSFLHKDWKNMLKIFWINNRWM